MIITIAVFIFMTVFGIIISLYYTTEIIHQKNILFRRLSVVRHEKSDHVYKTALVNIFMHLGRLILPQQNTDRHLILECLKRTGYRNENALSFFYGLRMISALGTALLILFFSMLLHVKSLVVCYAGVLLGYYLPLWLLKWKEKQRAQTIFRELPDALDMFIVCMNAGYNFDRALFRVSQELRQIAPVLSKEFERYFYEVESGLPVQEALGNLINRNQVEELTSVVQILMQSARFGTDIIHALKIHAESLRTKRRQMAEQKAAKVSVKLVFPTILFIMPAMILIILGPTGIRFIEKLKDLKW